MKADLIILGVLHRGDFHPYEIRRRIQAGMVDRLMELDTGTLYYAVKQLAKDGCIEVRGEERVARGGSRTIYGLTDRGRARFRELMLERFADPGHPKHPYYPALLFLGLVELDGFAELIQARIDACRTGLAALRMLGAHLEGVLGTGNRYILEHAIEHGEVEARWLERLRDDVAAGRVRDSDMEGVRARGMVPPELAHLLGEKGDGGGRG
ncbi:MAG TPA: PadR family transcriptional regulator [Azospirillaceae bacterium]|nr:PadR family transcriptional regulator [Azospirillaceae bacterium]